MSLFVLALNTIPLNSFASDLKERPCDRGFTDCIITCQTLGATSQIDETIPQNFMMKEKRTHEFEDIVSDKLVKKEDTINILDVDFQDETKFDFLNTILENKNILVNLIITPNSRFLNEGVFSMVANDLPINLKHLAIIDKNNLVIKIGDQFLSNCENLISFNSRGLKNVRQIGYCFLYRCFNLIYFDSRGLENLTQIERGFLTNCYKLAYFDARGLGNVTQIGDYFLFNSRTLNSFDALKLKSVIKIGKYFLANCYKLTHFDVRGLKNVMQIGRDFLSNCESLTSLDTSGLENLTQTGEWFLSNCENLTSLDTRGLKSVIIIKKGFLYRCNNVISLDVRWLDNVKTIEEHFLNKPYNLKEIITTPAKQWFWKENLTKKIKNLIKKSKITFLIKNKDQYKDIEERIDYVQENYTQEMSGLISIDKKDKVTRIGTKQGPFAPLMM